MKSFARTSGLSERAGLLGLIGVLLLGALLNPASAGAEACTGPAQRPPSTGRATGPVAVVVGKSIGPISFGMTRRAITRATGPGVYIRLSRYHFRVRRVIVNVTFGRDGRARTLTVASKRLVINGVPAAAGIDAVAAALPDGIDRSDCSSNYTEFSAVSGYRYGYLAFEMWASPAMAAIQMVDLSVPRAY